MGDKKKPGRFTLQFNQEDPWQRMVSELLEQQGRHKAQFITSAILTYTQCPPQGDEGTPSAIDEAALERMMFSIMEKNSRFAAQPSGKPLETKKPLAPANPSKEPWGASMADDALRAITDTLAAFQTE